MEMSRAQPEAPRPGPIAEAVEGYLRRMQEAGELHPGTRDTLARKFVVAFRPGSPTEAVTQLTAWLETPEAQVYLTGKAADGPFLRTLLNRLGIFGSAADEAFGELAGEILPLKPAAAARRVAIWLSRDANGDRYRGRREPTYHERRARAAIDVVAAHFDPLVDRDDLARQWAQYLGPMRPHEAAIAVARRLQMPHNAHLVRRGQPPRIDMSGPEFRPSDADTATRARQAQHGRRYGVAAPGDSDRPTSPIEALRRHVRYV